MRGESFLLLSREIARAKRSDTAAMTRSQGTWGRIWRRGASGVQRALWRRSETGWLFTLIAAAVYGAVLLFGHWQHEMWRDELHCFGIGRHAKGLWELLTGDRRYEGHPFLWYYLLHLVSRIHSSYYGLRVTTWLLAVGSAVLWLRHAPLPRLLKVMALGSYYLAYEYGVFSRSYTLGLFLTFAFCTLYHRNRVRYVASSVILVLLAATSVYGAVLSIALALFLFTRGPVLETAPPPARGHRFTVPASLVAGVGIFVIGLAIVFLTTRPPEDALYKPAPEHHLNLAAVKEAATQYWRAMFPYKGWKDWHWPSGDYLGSHGFTRSRIEWAAALWLGGLLVALRRAPRVAATYGFGIFLIAAVQFLIYPGAWRHIGHNFILLLACAWLYGRDRMDARRQPRLLYGMLAANFALLAVTAFGAYYIDAKNAFSQSTATMHFLKSHGLDKLPVVADVDAPVSPIAIMLNRSFVYPTTGEARQSPVFHNRRGGVSNETLLNTAHDMARDGTGRALVIVNSGRGQIDPLPADTRLVYQSDSAIMYDEAYFVYLVDTKPRSR